MSGEPDVEDLEFLNGTLKAFEEAALEKLETKEFSPRFDDFKVCVYVAMLEKMKQQYRDNGNRVVVTDAMEALQLLSLMELAKFINTMTRPENNHNEETGILANNAYLTAAQMEFDMLEE
jgi:hypothetical protein